MNAHAATSRPNVLLIMSDQYYHGAMGVAGNPVIRTPNLDRLAAEGVRFETALCTTPFCSPTRASILTGLFPHKHRITYNVRNPDRGLDPELPSTESALHDAGYQCFQRGKWHLGDKTRLRAYADDPELSYPDFLNSVSGGSPGLAKNGKRANRNITSVPAVEEALAKWGKGGVSIGRTDLPIEHTQETWIADTAIKQLKKSAGNPFFMTVSFPAPHAPWIINEPYYSMYDRSKIPLPANRNSVEDVDRQTASWGLGHLLGDEGFREYLAVFYGMVSMVDWNIGRVLNALRESGQEKNTLVIFVSDHGDMQGGHSMYGKTNFSIYEETTRIPLIMRYPGRIRAGRTVQTQVSVCDLQPTILDYLGLATPADLHGDSLRPFIDGREDLDRSVFCERERGQDHFQRVIRTREWKYVYSSSGSSQVYSIEKDPGETKNLIDDSSARAVKQRLHQQLTRWMRKTDDPRSEQMPQTV